MLQDDAGVSIFGKIHPIRSFFPRQNDLENDLDNDNAD
jgi:hypothetical protein